MISSTNQVRNLQSVFNGLSTKSYDSDGRRVAKNYDCILFQIAREIVPFIILKINKLVKKYIPSVSLCSGRAKRRCPVTMVTMQLCARDHRETEERSILHDLVYVLKHLYIGFFVLLLINNVRERFGQSRINPKHKQN